MESNQNQNSLHILGIQNRKIVMKHALQFLVNYSFYQNLSSLQKNIFNQLNYNYLILSSETKVVKRNMAFRDYQFGYRVLGQGLSSIVYKAKKYKSKQQFALKIIREDFLKSQFEKKLLLNEINVHEAVSDHKNFVRLYEHGKHENSYVFVMEYCQRGSLAQFLQKNKKLSEHQAIYIIKEVIEAYKMLYSQKILHRDIKPANILITYNNQIKLCDFGLSVKASDSHRAKNARIGTPCFMAPEVANKYQFTSKSDIWSIGVTYFLMLVGELPFKSQNYENFVKQLDQTNLQTLLPSNLSQFSRAFILKTLNTDHNQRMSPEQLFNFQFQSKPVRVLKPSISQKDIRKRHNQSLMLEKNASTNNLNRTLQNQTLSALIQTQTGKKVKKTEVTQSSLRNQKIISQNIQSSSKILNIQTHSITSRPSRPIVIPLNSITDRTVKNPIVAINSNISRTPRTPRTPLTPKLLKDQSKDTSISLRIEQTPKKLVQKALTKEEQKLLMKQMQKITKILINEIDFLRYTTKLVNSLQKYFKGQFQLLKQMMNHFVSVKLRYLKHLAFIQKDKLKTYIHFPIYKAWIELIDDYSKTLNNSSKVNFRLEDFQKLISSVILDIYSGFDKSVKTRLNASKLVTLDHLICFKDLLKMSKRGESYFLRYSMLNLILQGIEKMRIDTNQIEFVFTGISKKMTSYEYY